MSSWPPSVNGPLVYLHYLAGWLRRMLRWMCSPGSRMWPRVWGVVIVAECWILAGTHHPRTWWWHRSGNKQRGPDCFNDLFLWISRNCWNWACCLAISWFIVSFISCIVRINTSRCIRQMRNWTIQVSYVASCCHLPSPNLLHCLQLLHCLSLRCSHSLPSHSLCWNARDSCSSTFTVSSGG